MTPTATDGASAAPLLAGKSCCRVERSIQKLAIPPQGDARTVVCGGRVGGGDARGDEAALIRPNANTGGLRGWMFWSCLIWDGGGNPRVQPRDPLGGSTTCSEASPLMGLRRPFLASEAFRLPRNCPERARVAWAGGEKLRLAFWTRDRVETRNQDASVGRARVLGIRELRVRCA